MERLNTKGNLTPGEALAELLQASTPSEVSHAQKDLDAAHARLVQSASEQGIKMTFTSNFIQPSENSETK